MEVWKMMIIAAALLVSGYMVHGLAAQTLNGNWQISSVQNNNAFMVNTVSGAVYYCQAPSGVPVCRRGQTIENP